MIRHYILTSCSYELGTRIAMDFTSEDKTCFEAGQKAMEQIRSECGKDISLAPHILQTESSGWNSVIAYDPFFAEVKVYTDITAFIRTIKASRILSGMDIAKYILGKVSCTHTKLQKLVYLCYAEYLCGTGKKLFEDTIYAFNYGPVVSTVYDTFKKKGKDLTGEDPNSYSFSATEAAKSKILFAYDGIQKIFVVDAVLERYGMCLAKELVDITHRKGSPWERTFLPGELYQVISDKDILAYHEVERG